MERTGIYKEERKFVYSDYDINDDVLMSHIAEIFQDIAGNHSEFLGCGYEAVKSKDMIWVLAKTKIDVIKNPIIAKNVIVETIAYKPNGLIFARELIIKDKETGETLITGNSNWCLVSLSTRRLVRPNIDVVPFEQDDTNRIYKDKMKSLDNIQFEDEDFMFDQTIRFTDLDHNRHMNNCHYLDIITNAVSPTSNQRITSLEINYEKECIKDDEILVYKKIISDTEGFVTAYKKESRQLVFKSKYKLSYNADASKQTL